MVTARSLSSWTLTLLVLLGWLAPGMPTRPAAAATLTVTSLSCETLRAGLLCDGYVSGGTGGNTYTWNGFSGISTDYPDHSTVTLGCTPGTTKQVTFTVRDSSGASASKTITKYCSGGTP